MNMSKYYQIKKAHYTHDCWGSSEFSHYENWGGGFDTLEEAIEMVPRNGSNFEIFEIEEIVKKTKVWPKY